MQEGSSAPELTAVVCDDDRMARSVVTDLLEARGVRVLAETDRAVDAIDVIEQFHPDLVVLDTALQVGPAIEVVEHVAERGLPCRVVVFTAGVELAASIAPLTAAVVEKFDMESLERAVDAALRGTTSTTAATPTARDAGERRREARHLPPGSLRDETGLDDTAEFYEQVAAAAAGDALLAIDLTGPDPETVGRVGRGVIRAGDRMILRRDTLVVLLIGGGPQAPRAVADRFGRRYPGPAARPRGIALDEGSNPTDALARVLS